MIPVPAAFRKSALETFGAGATEFCENLPAIVDEYLDRWSLTLELPAGAEPWYGMCGIVVPVRTPAGQAAVLKISWADEETEYEHTALAAWSGNGAVRLLAADGPNRVLLLERLDPHRTLGNVPIDDAVVALGELLRRLAVPTPPGVESVAERAARWVDELPRRWRAARPQADDRLLDRAVGIARDLGPRSGTLLVHTDLHYENVLATLPDASPQRGHWLAIDPKPMAGDAEFGALPAMWNRLDDLDSTDPAAALRRRLLLLADAAGIDAKLAAAWSVARAVETVVWNAEIGLVQHQQRPVWIAETLTL